MSETVADFKERIAIMMRFKETGKRYSAIGASRAPECVLRNRKKGQENTLKDMQPKKQTVTGANTVSRDQVTAWDFSTPEGRLAAIESLGSQRYNVEMAKWKVNQEIEPFIRVIRDPRFGRIYWIDELACGYPTIEGARRALEIAAETGRI